jgi:aspartyl-tRNA(Asn)/glutamyl-tRNA(Gln) amidotransferase subunit A
LVQRDFDRVFARQNPLLDPGEASEAGDGRNDGSVRVLITPTAPTLPPTVEEVKQQTPVESYMNDIFTVPASLAGLPAASVLVSLPKEVRDGMEDSDVRSVGMQVVGQFGDDEGVLEVARIVEELQ